MVLQIILAGILLVTRIFPRPCGARKNTTELVKYARVLSVKPSNKVYILNREFQKVLGKFLKTRRSVSSSKPATL